MKFNLDYILLLSHDCVIFIAMLICFLALKVRVDDLETMIKRQQVQLEHQALDIMILKGK